MSGNALGQVKDWHRPSNILCRHNLLPTLDCNCQRPVKRKAYRVCRVTDSTGSLRHHERIVMEVHPNGLLKFREHKRRRTYETTVGAIYSSLVWAEARKAVASKRAARKLARRSK